MQPLRLLATLLAALAAGSALAQPAGKAAQAVRVSQAPVLDGVLDDPAWQGVAAVADFTMLEPDEGVAPTEPTEVYVVYDDENLYIGANLWDSRPHEITRKVMVRQPRLFGEDRLHIVLDTFNDRRNGFYFEVNPNGLRADALLENNNRLLQDWDGIWFAEARVHDRGWTVEIRIPFNTLSFDPRGTTWGLNFFRSIAARREYTSWSLRKRAEFPYAPSLAASLTGLSGMRQGIGVDVVPSFTARRDQAFAPDTTEERFEPSLDVLYKLTNATTAALTYNTDFSATEVDDRQVNLSRFSPFFPEKRVFFLQDAGIFEFGGLDGNGRPFFSRTIGLGAGGEPINLAAGAKVTGREGPASFGLLTVRQEASAGLPERDLVVGRAVTNVLDTSSVGLIATAGSPNSTDGNHTFGADFRHRQAFAGDQIVEATAWAVRSEPEGVDSDRDAFGGTLVLPNDRWYYELFVKEIQPNYAPAMGFVNRTGIRSYNTFLRFRSRPPDGLFRAHNHWVYVGVTTDLDNQVESSVVELNPWGPFTQGSDFFAPLFLREREVLDTGFLLLDQVPVAAGTYDWDFYFFRLETSDARALRLNLGLGSGEFYDGERDHASLDTTWRAHPRLTVDFDWQWDDIRLPAGRVISRLYGLKTAVAITPRIAWVTFAQFDNVSDTLGVDTRLQWLPQAGREVFLVFNHGSVREPGGSFRSETQDSVLKVTYTFRY